MFCAKNKGLLQNRPEQQNERLTFLGVGLSFHLLYNLFMQTNYNKQDQCTVYECHGQLVFALNSQKILPENAPVRLASAQLEELDYRKLYRTYSSRGRKSAVEPRVMFMEQRLKAVQAAIPLCGAKAWRSTWPK
ncbi:hypothetical protein B5F98_03965 [Pseudoflavonifractor sp. An44]|nr:hypothetical protein B5F98_03965 [Pseudoflavonifractor sp. An44]